MILVLIWTRNGDCDGNGGSKLEVGGIEMIGISFVALSNSETKAASCGDTIPMIACTRLRLTRSITAIKILIRDQLEIVVDKMEIY